MLALGATASGATAIGGTGALTIYALASGTAGQNGSSVAGLGYVAGTGIVVKSGERYDDQHVGQRVGGE